MSTPFLSVTNVHRSFGGAIAVNNASFRVERGSITGLIGPNGAGKTTVFNLISGFLRPESGSIEFDGHQIGKLSPNAVASMGLVRTFQIPKVFTRLTVLENMMLAAKHQPGEVFGAALFRPGRVSRREGEIREQANRLLDLVKLNHIAQDYAGELSGGQRKLLEYGRALMTEPRMVLLDEPMAGVAPPLGLQLLERILELRAAASTTFLVVEHNMDALMAIADRVVVMDEGRVISHGTPLEVQQDPLVMRAYLGMRTPPSLSRSAGVVEK